MTLYVAEISGRGIVAFDAANEDEAKAQMAGRAFQRDLHVLQNEGRPLWDGIAEILLRGALPKEAAAWQAGRETSAPSGENDHGPDRVFLVPVVDPSRFADDEDDDDRDDDDQDD